MSDPRPPVGGAGVRESISEQLDWTHDTAAASPSVAQYVTLDLPGLSLAAAFFHLDAPETAEADRDYRAEVLAEHVRKVVDTCPPLTAAQRDKITALLRARATRHDGEAPNDGEVGAAGLPRQRRHRAPVDGGQGAMR